MYISRYAVNSWGCFLSGSSKGIFYAGCQFYNINQFLFVESLAQYFPVSFSDKMFSGSRNIPALVFGLMNVIALCLFLLVPGVHFWIDVLAMVLFGLGIGVLICFLGGLMAVDIAPRNASGAALGVVGIASYIGAGLQDVMSGVSDRRAEDGSEWSRCL